jgi:hypothetical protein
MSNKKDDFSSEDGSYTVQNAEYAKDVEDQGGPKRQIGVVSAVFIIFNRMIGTGIFATPSYILSLSGSVGMSLIMWVIGSIIAAAGMWVYVVWGTVSTF